MTDMVTKNPPGEYNTNHKVKFYGTGLADIFICRPESTLLKATTA
jgi:hypothetical protein